MELVSVLELGLLKSVLTFTRKNENILAIYRLVICTIVVSRQMSCRGEDIPSIKMRGKLVLRGTAQRLRSRHAVSRKSCP